MQKYIVEGTSPISMAEAAIMAMAKAATYLSENHDIKITVLEMAAVKGRGYKVVLEVTLIPLTEGEAVQSDSQDVEPKRAAAAVDKERKQADDGGIKRRIMEHFRRRKGTFMETPSVHLAQLTEAMLLGHITTEFMQKEQPVNLGPLNDPLAVQKAAPSAPAITAAEEAIEDFQHATHPDDPFPLPEKKTSPRPPASDPE
jgi:hypothetical protein